MAPEHMVAAIDAWRRPLRDWAAAEEVDPWALPLVVNAAKNPAPGHTDTLEAAAAAVLALLVDPRSAPGGQWHEPLTAWMTGRIRKVTRRARGAKFEQVRAMPGVTAVRGTAQVVALPPTPVSATPPLVRGFQVSGLDLADPAPLPVAAGAGLAIRLSPEVAMSTGKACAQVGHAAQIALMSLDRDAVLAWASAEFPLSVRVADPSGWQTLTAAGRVGVVTVADAGFTEVAPGTVTCAAQLTP